MIAPACPMRRPGTAAEKMKALQEAGVTVVRSPADMGATVAKVIGK